MSSKLRTTKILKSDWRDWKRVGCHGNGNCYGCGCVVFRTISLPSFFGGLLQIDENSAIYILDVIFG